MGATPGLGLGLAKEMLNEELGTTLIHASLIGEPESIQDGCLFGPGAFLLVVQSITEFTLRLNST